MADADGRIIPLTEDDQGEGIKDFYDTNELESKIELFHEKLSGVKLKEALEKGKSDNEMLELILDKIEAIDRKIDRIFGGWYLINGRWEKPDILLNINK